MEPATIGIIVALVLIIAGTAIGLGVYYGTKSSNEPTITPTIINTDNSEKALEPFQSPLKNRTVHSDALPGEHYGAYIRKDGTIESDTRSYFDGGPKNGHHYDGVITSAGTVTDLRGNFQVLHDSGARRVFAHDDGVYYVLCETRVISTDATNITVLIENVQPIDAYKSNDDIVILTPNNVIWMKTNGEIFAEAVTRGHSLCEINGQVCAVGTPQEERVAIYDRGEMIESISLPGREGFTHFGYSIHARGNLLAVGTPLENDGTVYVYSSKHGPYLVRERIEPEMPMSLQKFGSSVFLKNDDSLLVGSTDYAEGRGSSDEIALIN